MIKLIIRISLFIISILFYEIITGQVTIFPKVDYVKFNNFNIVNIKIDDQKTSISLEYVKTKSDLFQSWVYITSNTFLSDYYNPSRNYKIQSIVNGQLDTKYSTRGKLGQKFYITFEFPKIPTGIEKINIQELVQDGFEWKGISINNPLVNPKSNWSEATLKENWKTNPTYPLEGIYETIITNPIILKIRVGLIKAGEGGYELIYLYSEIDELKFSWKEGDIKAFLSPSAQSNIFAAKWISVDRSVYNSGYLTFEGNVMKFLINGQDPIGFLKVFPIAEISQNSTSANPSTSGTGFAISNNFHIATNYHLISQSKEISVKGINGNFINGIPCVIVAFDKNNDLAILKPTNDVINLSPVPYSFSNNSSDPGENIFVLGYPLRSSMGDELKLTNGIISSKSGYQGDVTAYQVSAPVQPGNSGGPVFNKDGKIIGILNSKLQGGENVSYAIKINYLKTLLENSDIIINLISNNTLQNLSLQEQVKQIRNYIYIIESH